MSLSQRSLISSACSEVGRFRRPTWRRLSTVSWPELTRFRYQAWRRMPRDGCMGLCSHSGEHILAMLQVSALLVMLRQRGETPAEIAGMVRAMKKACRPIHVSGGSGLPAGLGGRGGNDGISSSWVVATCADSADGCDPGGGQAAGHRGHGRRRCAHHQHLDCRHHPGRGLRVQGRQAGQQIGLVQVR